jgi:hypothetical protein
MEFAAVERMRRRMKTNSSMAAFFVKRTFWGYMLSSVDERHNPGNTLAFANSRFPEEAEPGRCRKIKAPRKMRHNSACKPTAA